MTTQTREQSLETLLDEQRTFPPSPEFLAHKNLTAGDEIYAQAAADPEAFWSKWARTLEWSKPFETALDWTNAPFASWFSDGTLNASVNCVDRHVAAGRGARVAYHWEGEDGTQKQLTYAQLQQEITRAASALRALGVKRGDVVAIYLPMVLELPIAMLACARIGAAHSVVFGGFSAQAVADRLSDANCRLLITADGGYRRGKVVPLKASADEAMAKAGGVAHCLVVKRTGGDIAWNEHRDLWWHEQLDAAPSDGGAPEEMGGEDLLYLLYTSGTTAKPKGIMHTTAGYLTGVAATTKMVFDLPDADSTAADSEVYWCAADIGWVTGHSYIVYGPLTNGVTSVIYEGAPDFPQRDRLWDIIEKYKVTILYTAPTAIRACIKWGNEHPQSHDLSSLRLLGSVGEPINPEAWLWYHKTIGGEHCPIVDTWWQTETGQIMVSPLPGITTTKPGSATFALPGISAEIVDGEGTPVGRGNAGYLVMTKPWPAMARGIYGDPERYIDTYWKRFPGKYFAGDGAKFDDDGYIWLMGRVDDVMNISGHRVSTTEVESALVEHEAVAEAAVVGMRDDLTGEAVAAYVTIEDRYAGDAELRAELLAHVSQRIGKFARPKFVLFADELPKTRSGKIMRRLLRDIANGSELGDTSTLADETIVAQLKGEVDALSGAGSATGAAGVAGAR